MWKIFILVLSMQESNNKEDHDQIIILFQDMLEVVTRDIMVDQLSEYGT
jgi:callose synthase